MASLHTIVLAAVALCSFMMLEPVAGISFDLKANTKKCLQEDVEKDVLVVGEYDITDDDNQIVNIVITDSRGHVVYNREEATVGKFAFTSDDYDVFEICFQNEFHEAVAPPHAFVAVTLNLKVGADARSYDELAKAEKLKPLEVQLRYLEDVSESLVQSFVHMKEREAAHRDTNEATAEKMLHFSIFSMVCLLGLGVWQVLYLRRYFKSKKLID